MGRSFTKLAVLSLLMLLLYSCRSQKINTAYDPVRIDTGKYDKPYFYPQYRANQILVFFKKPPTAEQKRIIKAKIHGGMVDTSRIRIRSCKCNEYIEQWTAANIQNVIHGEGVRSGSTSGSKGVGEDSLAYYSLNYIVNLPRDSQGVKYEPVAIQPQAWGSGAKRVVVAVLDTGLDTTSFNRSGYLWTNQRETYEGFDRDGNCYISDVHGWNFADDNNNLYDNHPDRHGSLVSGYILREFDSAKKNFPQLMVLKTHHADGTGDMFGSICAVHYALKNGANIINASWGFYSYLDPLPNRPYIRSPHPYMDSLLSQILRANGVLFVTASGNKIEAIDREAHRRYKAVHHGVDIPDALLRNLWYHNFYPACVSTNDNNVITVVTTNGTTTSPTQNYSSRFVDLGVKANVEVPGYFKFYLPTPANTTAVISGSSYATGIATGKIGAYLPVSAYKPGISKIDVISELQRVGGPTSPRPFISSIPLPLGVGRIRDGVYLFPARR